MRTCAPVENHIILLQVYTQTQKYTRTHKHTDFKKVLLTENRRAERIHVSSVPASTSGYIYMFIISYALRDFFEIWLLV